MRKIILTLSCFLMMGALHLSAQGVEITVDNIKYHCSEDKATVTGYVSKPSGKLELPNTVTYNDRTYTVTEIGKEAIGWCEELTELHLPASLTTIGESAFTYCSFLTEVNLPALLTSIEQSAFQGCLGLTEVNLPASLTSIGYAAFSYCNNLNDIQFMGTSEPTIGENVFPAIDLWLPNVASGFTATKWNAKEIHYGQVPAAIDHNTQSSLRIIGEQGSISIHGGEGASYRVITIQGAIVSKGRVSSDTQSISVGSSGIYVVEVDGRTEKVMVK